MQPTCRHRPDCDGCPRFEQTPEKRAAELLAGLHRLAGLFELKPPSSIIHSEIDLGYRNRARMVVRNGRYPLGFFRAKSREFIGIQQCVVHTDTVEEVLGTVRLLGKHDVMQAAKFVDVRAGENAILTVSLKDEVTDEAVEDFKAQFLSMQPDVGLQLNRGKGHGVLAGQQEVVCGPETVRFVVRGLSFEVPPNAFFQLNTSMLETMQERMGQWIEDEDIIDTYCGVGVHGLALGKGHVYGMDNVEDAVKWARVNAATNNREATFEVVEDATAESWTPPFEDATVILNPTRAGVVEGFLDRISTSECKQILYVSCNPTSFFRDAERLARHGWQIAETHAFEMMPRTDQIELVVRFARGKRLAVAPKAAEHASIWVALADGVVPHGELPGGNVKVRRIRNYEGASVIRITSVEPIDADTLAKSLRAWKHPLIGDSQFGSRPVNSKWLREAYVDVPMLACIRDGRTTYKVPGFFCATVQLPARTLERD